MYSKQDVRFEDELLRVWVASDVCRETDGGRTLAGRVDTARGDLVDILGRMALSASLVQEKTSKGHAP